MSADISRDISMEEIPMDTKMNIPRCSTPTEYSHTHIFIEDSMDIPEPEDPNEKDDKYMLLKLALRTSFVYKKRNKNCVRNSEDATAGPSNWNQSESDSINDSSVQVHDVTSSDMSFTERHLVEKKRLPTENQGITFSVEKYFLNTIKQDSPPPKRHAADTDDADTDMEIDVMTIDKDKNLVSDKETESTANTLQSYDYNALMPTCYLCKKSRCPIRDKYLGEKLMHHSIPEPSQIDPKSLQPALHEDVQNSSQVENTQGNQCRMKYVKSAPLTDSGCAGGSIKNHQSNNSFGSVYPVIRGLIAPIPIRPIEPYYQLEYITSSTSTCCQERTNFLQHPGQSVTTVPVSVSSAAPGCDYWNLSLGVSHPVVPNAPLNLTMYSQERLVASNSQESFSTLGSSAFVPYQKSEFSYSPVLLNNHWQYAQQHSSVPMPGVHSPFVDSVSSTVHDRGSIIPDILLPVNEQCAHYYEKAAIAPGGYWCPPLPHYIP